MWNLLTDLIQVGYLLVMNNIGGCCVWVEIGLRNASIAYTSKPELVLKRQLLVIGSTNCERMQVPLHRRVVIHGW